MSEYDNIPAGRKMDALVAEKVMGVERVHGDITPWLLCRTLPRYSTDDAAALAVVREMRKQGYEFALIGDDRREIPDYAAEFDKYDGNIGETTYLHGSRAAEIPLAICRAALEAKESEQ